jgi:hypothetical protein
VTTKIRFILASMPLALIAPSIGIAQELEFERKGPADTVLEYRSSSPDHKGHQAPPEMDEGARPSEYDMGGFAPDPVYTAPYDAEEQLIVYGGKTNIDEPRPLIEWGYPMYSEGEFGSGINIVGAKNLVRPQFLVYGDWRTVLAANDNGEVENAQLASQLNLEFDLNLTATERLHMFVKPLDDGKQTRLELGGTPVDDVDGNGFQAELDFDPETFFFEGDWGYIQSGLTDKYTTFDLPFAVGLVPLFLQNGLWVNDAFVGGAVTLQAKNSPKFDITNYDATFFVGLNKVSTPVFITDGVTDDNAGKFYALTTFVDVAEGYLEAGYARVTDDRDDVQMDYNNVMLGWTKRYGGKLSNSVRLLSNFGQDPVPGVNQTADGFVLLVENSWITHLPSTLVPYFNFFYGKDKPQPLATGAAGILKNTGVNFETDGITGFPKLDDTANDTFGGAIGVMYLFALDQQLIVEYANVQIIGNENDPLRNAPGDQQAIGVRYQKPISRRWIFRTDAIYGERKNLEEVSGVRVEMRMKF